MTQKATVRRWLEEAGDNGILSKTFIASYMPRAAARIQELKDEGVQISSEREGKYTRYRLVGCSAGTQKPQGPGGLSERRSHSSVASSESVASGAKGSRERLATLPVESLEGVRPVEGQPSVKAPDATSARPSLLDWDADWSAA